MTTKFDIGEDVLLRVKIRAIRIRNDSSIRYEIYNKYMDVPMIPVLEEALVKLEEVSVDE